MQLSIFVGHCPYSQFEQFLPVVLERKLHSIVVYIEAVMKVDAPPVLKFSTNHDICDRIAEQVGQGVVTLMKGVRRLRIGDPRISRSKLWSLSLICSRLKSPLCCDCASAQPANSATPAMQTNTRMPSCIPISLEAPSEKVAEALSLANCKFCQ